MAHDSRILPILKKIWRLLTPPERRGAIEQAFLMLMGMGLETMSVGLVIPLLALLSRPDFIERYPPVQSHLASFGISGQEQLIVVGLVVFLGIYVVKTIFLGFLAWRQAAFALGIETNLSQRLFAMYLRQPYAFHLQRNSAQLIRNVTTEAAQLKETLYFGMQLLTEILVLLGLAALLLFIEPLGLLVLGTVLAVAGWSFLRITRRRIVAWGLAQQHHQGQRIQHLQQGLASVKDVRLLGREAEFIGRYSHHTASALRAGQRQLTVQQFPRLWLELLAMGGLTVLVFTMIYQGRTIESILPTMGVFAAAAFRLMPSVTRVVNAIQTLRYGLHSINNLSDEMQLSQPEGAAREGQFDTFGSMIELAGVSYTYPGATNRSLDNVSLTIRKGEAVGFIGASGAGKSTLADVLLGLLSPDAGRVLVDGHDIGNDPRVWQSQIGYVPQTIYLTDDTLRRNVAFGLSDDQIDDAAIRNAIQAAQLEDFVAALPDGLETMVGERGIRLSGGQRQRIGIARALYHAPSVLVLDEATSALDTETEAGVMESVRALKGEKTVIIVAHRLSTIRDCDRLYRLECGGIAQQGTFNELMAAAA